MLKKPSGTFMEHDGRYVIRLNLYPNGKRLQKWITTDIPVKRGNLKRIKDLVEQVRNEYIYDTDPEKNKLLQNRRLTVADCLNQFYQAKVPNIKLATQKNYRCMLDKQLIPFFEKNNATMADLSTQMLQQLMNTLQVGRKAETVIRYYALLKQALDWAIRQDLLLTTNPMNKIERPRKVPFVAAHYQAEEMRTLLAVAKNDPLYVPIVLAAYYGLRRSETVAVMWDSIDFERGFISIDHSVYQDGRKIYPDATLKTKSSYRVLPLIPEVRDVLLQARKTRDLNKKLFGRSYNRDYLDFVCVRPDGMLLKPDYVSTHFPLLLKQNNLPHIRFHDLRHSCATMLLQAGLSLPQIQKWLGHSDIGTTVNRYGHLEFDAKLPLADKMEFLLGGTEQDGDDHTAD